METNQENQSQREQVAKQNKAALDVMRSAGVVFEPSYRTQDGTLIVESAATAATRLANMGLLHQEHIVQLQQAGLEV